MAWAEQQRHALQLTALTHAARRGMFLQPEPIQVVALIIALPVPALTMTARVGARCVWRARPGGFALRGAT